MNTAACVLLAMILAAFWLIVSGASWAERKWRSIHPPDDYDGMREDRGEDE